MYTYKIGYYSYEEAPMWELKHDKYFTEEQIGEMIALAIFNLGERFHNFDQCSTEVVNYLVDNYGFEELEYDTVWTCFGWASIMDKRGWVRERDDNLDKLNKLLTKMGWNQWSDPYFESQTWRALQRLAPGHFGWGGKYG